MNYSLNEFKSLAKGAARGSGVPWGVAEEVGANCYWLAKHGVDSASMLADFLEDGGFDQTDDTNPFFVGMALNDGLLTLPHTSNALSFPGFILPFLAWVSMENGRAIDVSWGTAICQLNGENLRVSEGADLSAAAAVTITQGTEASIEPLKLVDRCHAAPEVWARLQTFVHRTYAPATEESRMLGAGAGVTDND